MKAIKKNQYLVYVINWMYFQSTISLTASGSVNPRGGKERGVNPYHSAFNSRTNRDKYLMKCKTPDPGVYEIQKNVIKPIGYKHTMNSANFCKAVDIKKEAN